MALLTYKNYWVEKATVDYLENVKRLLYTRGIDRADQDRINRKNQKIAEYIVSKEHSYIVRDASEVYGVVCFDLNDFVELEYLYSTKKYYNVPIVLLMNYVLNKVFVGKKIVCESLDVTTFKSVVERVVRIADYYVVKDTFKEFVKRYEDG